MLSRKEAGGDLSPAQHAEKQQGEDQNFFGYR